MNNSNVKLMSSAMLIAMMANVILPVAVSAAGTVTDKEYLDAFDWAKTIGLTTMADADAFMPLNTGTREQLSRFLSVFATEVLGTEADEAMACDFSDITSADATLTDYVVSSCQQGLLKGSNGKFMPKTVMTKAQFVVALVRGLDGDKSEVGASPWYENYCTWAQDNGITNESDCAALDRPITRYEALLMLYRGSGEEVVVDPVDPVDPTTTGTTNVGGALSLTLAPSSPKGNAGTIYVPKTSTNNRVLDFEVSADKASALTTVTVAMDDSYMTKSSATVSLIDENGVKVTNTRTFNNNGEASLSFTTPINLAADAVKKFTVMFDFSGSVNQRTVVSIKNATSNGTTTIASNVASVYINTVDISSTQGTVTFDAFGGTNTPSLTCSKQVYIGDKNIELGRFRLSYNTSSTKDALVQSIRFRATKNLAGLIGNLTLKSGTGTVAATSYIDGKYVTFVFTDGYTIPYGQERSFYVYGDVIGGLAADPIELSVQYASDITAVEKTANMVSLNTDLSSNTYSIKSCIKEGLNSISRADTLQNTNIPQRERNIQGLIANVNVKSTVKVEKVRVYANVTTSTGAYVNPSQDIENVQMRVNGLVYDTLSTSTCGSLSNNGCYYEFNYYGDLNAGANPIEIRFDTKASAMLKDKISFRVLPSSIVFGNNAEYTTTSNLVLLADINGSADGTTFNIVNSAVDNISIVAQTDLNRVRESADFQAIKFTVRSNNVNGIVLNGFKLNIAGGLTSNANYVTDATVTIDGITSTQSFNNGMDVTFNSLGIVIPSGTTKTITVNVKTTSSHPAGAVQYSVNGWDISDNNGNNVSSSVSASANPLMGQILTVQAGINVTCQALTTASNTSTFVTSANTATIGTFEFRSQYGTTVLRELALANVTAAGATVPTTTLVGGYSTTALAPNFDGSSDGVILEIYNGSTKVGEGVLSNAIAYITNLNVNIPANTAINLTVKAIVPAEKTSGSLRLRAIDPNLSSTAFLNGTAQTLVSALSSNATVNGSCTANTTRSVAIRKTSITATTASSTSTLNLGGESKIYDGTLTVDAAGSIALGSLSFITSSNKATFTNVSKVVINGVSYLPTTEFAPVAITLDTPYKIDFAAGTAFATSPLQLAPGTYTVQVYAIPATVATAAGTYSTSTRIANPSGTASAVGTTYAGAPAAASIVWNDNSNGGVASYTDSNWYTDAGLTSLPTSSYTLN